MVSKDKGITFETLIEQINNQFEYVAEIYVAHLPTAPSVSQFHITVHTGEAESVEQYIQIASVDEVTVDIGEDEPLYVPFEVVATVDGPGHLTGADGTTVYMADNVLGAEPRELDTGMSMLRQKLAGTCPVCQETVDSIRDHYRESRLCQEAERV